MKTKLVLWGMDSQDKRVLIALELLPETNMVHIYTFPESVATEDFSQRMLKEWRNNEPVEFPEDHNKLERELSVTESLLPEEIKVERGDIIQRAQTEWHFIVLSAKLNDSYQSELSGLKERVDKLENYDPDIWNSLKGFWEKVQVQVRERNLFREHANALRDNTNALFARMKELRVKLDDEFQRLSTENHDRFIGTLENIERRISEGLRLQPIFDELKDLQRKFRDTKLTREHRSKVWERLDNAFKTVKAKRFGAGAAEDKSPMERLTRRYDGLIAAIEKMERSIQRDRDDLDFQNRKIEASDGQLEAQIRQAKIKMIQERINSKQSKLGEMMQTKGELDRRIEAQKEKDAKRQERERLEEAKRLAEEKIASQIQKEAAAREDESDKFEKAADALGVKKTEGEDAETEEQSTATEAAPEEESTPATETTPTAEEAAPEEESLMDKAEDAVEQAMEKAKEFAGKIEEKVQEVMESEKVEGIVESAKEFAEKVENKVEEAVEGLKEEGGILEKVEDTIEDSIDTVKAVASVLGEKIGEAVEGLTEQLSGDAAAEQEPGEDTSTSEEKNDEEE